MPVPGTLLQAVKRLETGQRTSRHLIFSLVSRGHLNAQFLLDIRVKKRYLNVELPDRPPFLIRRSEHHADALNTTNRKEHP